MTKELTALHRHTPGTWYLYLRKISNLFSSLHKIKSKPEGSVERYKTQLVTEACPHKYCMDYKETFALVVKITIV